MWPRTETQDPREDESRLEGGSQEQRAILVEPWSRAAKKSLVDYQWDIVIHSSAES